MAQFELTIKVEAPVGNRRVTVTKLLKKLLEEKDYFTVTKLNEEHSFLKILYSESPQDIKRHQD